MGADFYKGKTGSEMSEYVTRAELVKVLKQQSSQPSQQQSTQPSGAKKIS